MEEASGPPMEAEVWPDNWRAVEVFLSMGTQWRTGMGGATGLDYVALPAVMALCGVPESERDDTFAGLRVMERVALNVMNKRPVDD